MSGRANTSTERFIEGIAQSLKGIASQADSGARETFYQGVLHALPFAIVVFDTTHRYRYLNPAAIGNPEIRQWIIGKDDFEYCAYRGFDMKRAEVRRQVFLRATSQREPQSFEEQLTGPEGETLYYWRHFVPVYQDNDLLMTLGYSMDISPLKRAEAALNDLNQKLEQRVQDRTLELEGINKQLEVIALYDVLTGLPNRTLLKDRLAQAYRNYQRDPQDSFALLFLDTDGFKAINDTFGHDAGDEFLKALGQRLSSCVRESDTVARFGGDEFVILLQANRHLAHQLSVETAERIQATLAHPFAVAGHSLTMTSSIGIVTNVDNYSRPEDVLRDADIAMYQAKRSGRATFRVFQRNDPEEAERPLIVEHLKI